MRNAQTSSTCRKRTPWPRRLSPIVAIVRQLTHTRTRRGLLLSCPLLYAPSQIGGERSHVHTHTHIHTAPMCAHTTPLTRATHTHNAAHCLCQVRMFGRRFIPMLLHRAMLVAQQHPVPRTMSAEVTWYVYSFSCKVHPQKSLRCRVMRRRLCMCVWPLGRLAPSMTNCDLRTGARIPKWSKTSSPRGMTCQRRNWQSFWDHSIRSSR